MVNTHKRFRSRFWSIVFFVLAIFIAFSIGGALLASPVEHAEMDVSGVWESTMEIFSNNLSLLVLNFLGIFTLGAINIYTLLINALDLGETVAIAFHYLDAKTVLLRIVPHAILELPVIILGISVGFLPWLLIYSKVRAPECTSNLIRMAIGFICKLFLVCVALTLIAAVIESNISMR